MIKNLSNSRRIEIITGDITQQDGIDAIVNAANAGLSGGSGVCGAIFRAAGWDLLQEACNENPMTGDRVRCPTGQARCTPAFNLPNKGIIHAVGPIYNRSPLWPNQNAEELASAYLSSLQIAAQNGWTSVAFPAISCGIYGYPHWEGATVALRTVEEFLMASGTSVTTVRFVFLPFMDGPELQRVFTAVLSGADQPIDEDFSDYEDLGDFEEDFDEDTEDDYFV